MHDDMSKIWARIGYIGNQQSDCSSPDSFIALGSTGGGVCHNKITKVYCGNVAACYPDNGDKFLPTMGYILVQ